MGHRMAATEGFRPARSGAELERTTLQTLRGWSAAGEHFDVFSCFDPTTAHWLCLGGARVLRVGGHRSPTSVHFPIERSDHLGFVAAQGAAVARIARSALVIVEYECTGSETTLSDETQIQLLCVTSHAAAIEIIATPDRMRSLLSSSLILSVPVVAHLVGLPALPKVGSSAPHRMLGLERTWSVYLDMVDAGAQAVVLDELAPADARIVSDRLSRHHPSLPVLGSYPSDVCLGRIHHLDDMIGCVVDEASSASPGIDIVEVVRTRLAGGRAARALPAPMSECRQLRPGCSRFPARSLARDPRDLRR